MTRTNYRRIWERHHGPIPEDQPYDIHHIDGDHTNNDISNLQLVTLQEHYDIHKANGDLWACQALLMRLQVPFEEQRLMYAEAGKARKGILRPDMIGDRNPMRDPAVAAKVTESIRGKPKSNLARDSISKAAKERSAKKVTCEHCNKSVDKWNYTMWHGANCIDGPAPKARITNFNGNNPSTIKKTCEHCGKEAGLGNYTKWHGSNCRILK